MNPSTQLVECKPIVRCLVIQLARLGDTLQSLMALRAIQQLYPELEIHFVCRESFSAAARRVSWLKEVIVLPTQTLLQPLLQYKKTEAESLDVLRHWIAPIQNQPWDLIVNWSFSEASSYLTQLVPARIKLGYYRGPDASLNASDGWSQYMQAIVQDKIDQNIHLTDILTTQLLTTLQIYSGAPHQDGNAAVTSKGFFNLILNEVELREIKGHPGQRSVGIQLGTSQKTKSWNAQNWVRLIQLIFQRHPDYRVYLLGGKEDQAIEKAVLEGIAQFPQAAQVLFSWVGRSSFDLWAAIIGRCQWVISADTAAIHLASVLGTRVLNISLGSAKFGETGPYGNGHYVVAGSDAETVSAEAVYSTWTFASQEWSHHYRQVSLEAHFGNLGWTEKLKTVGVYRTQIRHTDQGGGIFFENLHRKHLSINEWSSLVVGQIARYWYCGWTPPVGQELNREMIDPSLIKILRELNSSVDVLTKIFDQAHQTALLISQKGALLRSSKLMRLQDQEELATLGTTLLDLDHLVERLCVTHPSLLAFANLSKVLMHNLQGNYIVDVGAETARCYKQMNEGVQIFKDWIKFSLDLAKPKALQPTFKKDRPSENNNFLNE